MPASARRDRSTTTGRSTPRVGIPIILQDIPQAPVPPGLALRLAEDCRNVAYIKVETLPITDKVADMAAAAGDALTIFGGAGGSYFIEEMRRGAQGTMPFCSQPAAFVETWNRFQRRRRDAARDRSSTPRSWR